MRVNIKGRVLRAARRAKRLTVDETATKAGVSPRTIHTHEGRDVSSIEVANAEALATVVGLDVAALLVADDAPTAGAPAASAPVAGAPAAGEIPPPRVQRAPSRLDALAAREPASDGRTIDARKLKQLLTAFATFENERFLVEGRVDEHRAITKAEARLLGTKAGLGGRFHVMRPVVDAEELGITVHTTRGDDTRALMAARGKSAKLEVRVVVAAEEEPDGFVFFLGAAPSPWALAVVELVAVDER